MKLTSALCFTGGSLLLATATATAIGLDIRLDLQGVTNNGTPTNWNSVQNNANINDLIDIDGSPTGIGLTTSGMFNSYSNSTAWGAVKDWVDPLATQDGIGTNFNPGLITFTNLDSMDYTVEVMVSNTNFNQVADYLVNGVFADRSFNGSTINVGDN